jgi:hypothetical protein
MCAVSSYLQSALTKVSCVGHLRIDKESMRCEVKSRGRVRWLASGKKDFWKWPCHATRHASVWPGSCTLSFHTLSYAKTTSRTSKPDPSVCSRSTPSSREK